MAKPTRAISPAAALANAVGTEAGFDVNDVCVPVSVVSEAEEEEELVVVAREEEEEEEEVSAAVVVVVAVELGNVVCGKRPDCDGVGMVVWTQKVFSWVVLVSGRDLEDC
jgi:hypothetical protein